jgi:hypothetical protein
MAVFGRARRATGAGVIATLILILAFGNEAFAEPHNVDVTAPNGLTHLGVIKVNVQ